MDRGLAAHTAHREELLLLGVGVHAVHADSRGQLRGVPREPGRAVAVGGTRLARRRAVAELRRRTGARLDDRLQHVGDVVGDVGVEGLGALLLVLEGDLAVLLHLLHRVGVDLLAVGRERRVRARQADRTGRRGAQGEGGGQGGQLVLVQARLEGGLLYQVGPDVHAELDEGGVHRELHGRAEGDEALVLVTVVHLVPLAAVLVVPDLAPVVAQRQLVVAVVDAVRRHERALAEALLRAERRIALAVRHRGGQDERLEGRADLHTGVVRVVGEVLQGVLTAVDGDDLARLGLHRGPAELHELIDVAHLRLDVRLAHLFDRLRQSVDLVPVERGVDLVAALVQLGLADPGVGDDVVVGEVGEVADLPGTVGRRLRLLHLGEALGDPLVALGRVHAADLDLAVQRPLPPVGGPLGVLLRGRRRALAAVRVVQVRTVQGGRQERALARRQVRAVLVEVRPRGGLDAVGPAPVVGGVEIARKDEVLVLRGTHLHGDEQLGRLALERLLLAQVSVLHELLRDGRAALRLTALCHLHDRSGDAHRVDAPVLLEAGVLGGDHRVLHRLGDLRDRHDLPVEAAAAGDDHLFAVRPVVNVLLDDRGLLRARDLDHRQGHAHDAHDQSRERERQPRDQLPGGDPAPRPLLARTRVVDDALRRRTAVVPAPAARTAGAGVRRTSASAGADGALARATGVGPARGPGFVTTAASGRGRTAGWCGAAAGRRLLGRTTGRGSSTALRRRRLAAVLAHRTTTPRAGAIA